MLKRNSSTSEGLRETGRKEVGNEEDRVREMGKDKNKQDIQIEKSRSSLFFTKDKLFYFLF